MYLDALKRSDPHITDAWTVRLQILRQAAIDEIKKARDGIG
jgi:hypothetical protein